MNTDPNTSSSAGRDDRKLLAERLREAREYLGFTQEEIAAHLGLPRSAVSMMEAGQRKVDALELTKLASLYKRRIAYFTGEEFDEPFGADIQHLARKVSELSPDDRDELSRFADFLRVRKKGKEG